MHQSRHRFSLKKRDIRLVAETETSTARKPILLSRKLCSALTMQKAQNVGVFPTSSRHYQCFTDKLNTSLRQHPITCRGRSQWSTQTTKVDRISENRDRRLDAPSDNHSITVLNVIETIHREVAKDCRVCLRVNHAIFTHAIECLQLYFSSDFQLGVVLFCLVPHCLQLKSVSLLGIPDKLTLVPSLCESDLCWQVCTATTPSSALVSIAVCLWRHQST